MIEHKVDVPISEQEFVFANKSLENLFSLAEYKICKLNTINLIWKHDGNIKIFVKNFLRKQLYFQGLETYIYYYYLGTYLCNILVKYLGLSL